MKMAGFFGVEKFRGSWQRGAPVHSYLLLLSLRHPRPYLLLGQDDSRTVLVDIGGRQRILVPSGTVRAPVASIAELIETQLALLGPLFRRNCASTFFSDEWRQLSLN